MREVLTEFDELMNVVNKMDKSGRLDESVMPYVNGRLVNSDSYNKVQKLLDCPEMISSHKWLYNLDLDQLEEDEIEKIDKLYDLGCNRGFIADDLTHFDDDGNCIDDYAEDMMNVTNEPETCNCNEKFTAIYSATDQNGTIKTGEAYSNADSQEAAKQEVVANLTKIGYSNVTILAIEKCECASESDTSFNEDDVEENDMLKGRVHNGHIVEDDDSSDDSSDDDSEEDNSSDDSSDDDSEDSDSDEDTADDSADEDADSSSDDDSADTDDASDDSDDASEDKDADEDTEDDDSKEDSDDDSDDTEDEDSDDAEDASDGEDGDSDDDSEDKDADEDSEDDDSEDDSDEDLSEEKKTEYKNDYKKIFKNTLTKCKFDVSFDDLTIDQKVKFLTELGKVWKKNEPKDFMSDKEIDQLNKVVVKPE